MNMRDSTHAYAAMRCIMHACHEAMFALDATGTLILIVSASIECCHVKRESDTVVLCLINYMCAFTRMRTMSHAWGIYRYVMR